VVKFCTTKAQDAFNSNSKVKGANCSW